MVRLTCFTLIATTWLLTNPAIAQCNEGCETLFEIQGEAAGDQFGWQAASIGDVTGDGIADFYSTATQNDAGGTSAGRAYVYNGASGSEIYRITGKRGNEQFGWDCKPVGDLDGDGVTELVIGAPWNGAGHASIHSGIDGSLINELTGESPGIAFGYRVASTGDFNGDGQPDFAIGALFFSGAGPSTGRVYVYADESGELITTLDGLAGGDRFGTSISAVGDLNNDGRTDLVIGADNAGSGQVGRAYVVSWDGAQAQTLFELAPTENGRDFGQFFANGGHDMNCDQVPDIYVADFVGNRAYVFSGADGELIRLFKGDGNGQFGLGEMVDDIDNDGYADMVLAAWVSNRGAPQAGKAFIYSGRDGQLLRSMTHNRPSAQFGFDAGGMGDIDGDGTYEFIITAANDAGGRGTLYVIRGNPYDPPDANLICQSPTQLNYSWIYPWISYNDQFESLLVANNLGDQPIHVQFTARRESGPEWTSELVPIPAHGFISKRPSELFADLNTGNGFAVVMASDRPTAAGRWVTNNLQTSTGASPSQAVAVALHDLDSADVGNQLAFGYLPLDEGLLSSPVVVNLGSEPAAVTLTFYNQQGQQVAQNSEILDPLRPFARVVTDLVPQAESSLMMTASASDVPLAGLVFVFNEQRETAIGNASGMDDLGSAQELIYPWVSNNDQFESILIVNNVAEETTLVQLTATRSDGSHETTGPIAIQAHGFLERTASELFPSLGDGSGYSVHVVAESGAILGRWVTNNLQSASGRSPSQAVAIDPSKSSRYLGNQLEYGFLPVSQGLTSAPVILNLSADAVDIRLRFYDRAGELVRDDSQTLTAHQPLRPFAAVVNNLVGVEFGDLVLVADTPFGTLTGVTFVFNAGSEPAMGNATQLPEPP